MWRWAQAPLYRFPFSYFMRIHTGGLVGWCFPSSFHPLHPSHCCLSGSRFAPRIGRDGALQRSCFGVCCPFKAVLSATEHGPSSRCGSTAFTQQSKRWPPRCFSYRLPIGGTEPAMLPAHSRPVLGSLNEAGSRLRSRSRRSGPVLSICEQKLHRPPGLQVIERKRYARTWPLWKHEVEVEWILGVVARQHSHCL